MSGPRERPILFSGSMIKAILEGRKSQTRRLVDVRDIEFIGSGDENGPDWNDPRGWGYEADDGVWYYLDQSVKRAPHQDKIRSPYGEPGDHLWVRETLRRLDEGPLSEQWCYAADGRAVHVPAGDAGVLVMRAWAHHKEGDVCVSIHMPRWASRITLEVTAVRVERLQDISEDDARAEGVPDTTGEADALGLDGPWYNWTLRQRFAKLWDIINGKRAPWSSNPWVWVVGFRRLEPKA